MFHISELASVFLFLIIISSGSFFGAVCFKKRYEETLPVTCIGFVLILFCSGLWDLLQTGAVFLLLTSALLYLVSIFFLVKKRVHWRELKICLLTPGAIIFWILALLLCYVQYGMLAHNWDEFSHWADIVKVMTTLETFGTNWDSHSAFRAYPPGMALFQYFLEKVYLFISGGNSDTFCEWLLYLAYDLLCAAILLPHFRKAAMSDFIWVGFAAALLFVLPLFFYSSFYESIYIDASLGIFCGAGIVAVIGWKQEGQDFLRSIYVLLLMSALVLLKDSGVVFAIFLGAFYTLQSRRGLLKRLGLSAAAIGLPRFAWQWKTQQASSFSLSLSSIKYALTSGEGSYSYTVIHNFLNALRTNRITFGHSFLYLCVSYAGLFFLSLILLFLLLRKKAKIDGERRSPLPAVLLYAGMQVTYIVGICLVYLFNFGDAEQLPSFDRYICSSYLTAMLVLVLVWLQIILTYSVRERNRLCITGCLVLLLIIPLGNLRSILTRKNVSSAAEIRSWYAPLVEKIEENCETDSKIYIISQESNGFDKWVLKYSIRPRTINDSEWNWSIGEAFYEGDVWTCAMTADEWKELLLSGDYDYVALFQINDYFTEYFSSLFEFPEDICMNSLYWFDANRELLISIS